VAKDSGPAECLPHQSLQTINCPSVEQAFSSCHSSSIALAYGLNLNPVRMAAPVPLVCAPGCFVFHPRRIYGCLKIREFAFIGGSLRLPNRSRHLSVNTAQRGAPHHQTAAHRAIALHNTPSSLPQPLGGGWK